MTTQPGELGDVGELPRTGELPRPATADRRSTPLAFFLLVAAGIMTGGMFREGFGHPLPDVIGLLIVLIAGSAALPSVRYALGEAMVGMSVVLLVLPPSLGLGVGTSLELVAGAVLLVAAGALHMERYPPRPPDTDDDPYWRRVSLTAVLLDLLARRHPPRS